MPNLAAAGDVSATLARFAAELKFGDAAGASLDDAVRGAEGGGHVAAQIQLPGECLGNGDGAGASVDEKAHRVAFDGAIDMEMPVPGAVQFHLPDADHLQGRVLLAQEENVEQKAQAQPEAGVDENVAEPGHASGTVLGPTCLAVCLPAARPPGTPSPLRPGRRRWRMPDPPRRRR